MKPYLTKLVVVLVLILTVIRIVGTSSKSLDDSKISDVYVAITDAKSTIEDKNKSNKENKVHLLTLKRKLNL